MVAALTQNALLTAAPEESTVSSKCVALMHPACEMNQQKNKTMNEITMNLRMVENAAAVRDLVAKRDYLVNVPRTPNVSAGRDNGSIWQVVGEINASIVEIIRIDLVEGRVAY